LSRRHHPVACVDPEIAKASGEQRFGKSCIATSEVENRITWAEQGTKRRNDFCTVFEISLRVRILRLAPPRRIRWLPQTASLARVPARQDTGTAAGCDESPERRPAVAAGAPKRRCTGQPGIAVHNDGFA
jgi:hypothetical protein